MKTRQLTLCAFFIILYTLGSKITIPTGLIPLTMQTMICILAALLLRPNEILLSYGGYFLLGLLGLPVFANGGGIGYLLQPSFGFLLSFPLAAALISWIKEHFRLHTFVSLYPLCLLALCVIYTIGCGYMYLILNFYLDSPHDLSSVIAIGVLPFLITDSISIAVGCFCALRLFSITSIQRALCLTSIGK